MSLGVLNNISAVYAENNLNNTTNSLNTVLQQLSSGSKINSGADDAAGLSLVNGLQANQQALNQSKTNATEGVGLLQVADGALSQVTSLLNRAVTLATEASNGTLNGSQDTAANQEYQSILSEINNIGTTTTFNQQTVFGSNTNIYTGDSSAQGAAINDLNIGSLSSANVGDTGGTMGYSSGQTASNVFVDLSNDGTLATANDSLGAAGSTTSLQVSYLTTGADGVAQSNTGTITVGQGTQYQNTAQGLINAINGSGYGLTASMSTASAAGAGAVAEALSANNGGGSANDTGIMISGVGVGTGTNSVGEVGQMTVASTQDDTLAGSLSIVGSDGKTHSVTLGTQGSTDTLTNLAATINAAGYGVHAAVANLAGATGQQLTFTSANSAVTVAGTGVTSTLAANSTDAVNAAGGGNLGTMQINSQTDILTGSLTITSGKASGGIAFGGVTAAEWNGQTSQTAVITSAMNMDFSTLQTDLASVGITASLSGSTVTFTATSGDSPAPAFSGTSLTEANAGTGTSNVTLAGTPTPGAQFSSKVGTLAVGTLANYGETIGGSMTIGSQTINITAADNTLSSLASTINAGDYGVTANYSQANADIVFTSANSNAVIASSLTGTGLGLTGENVISNGGASSTDSSAYYNVGISLAQTGSSGNSTLTTAGVVDYSTAVKVSGNETYGGTGSYSQAGASQVNANVGMVSDLSGTNGIATISYTDAAGQTLAKTDLSSQGDAQTALTSLNAAISDVAAQDGYIGAQINTLNAASSVLSTQSENVQSAQNAVQATDYASATSNMSKYEILSQTGISALAQANSMQQEVTKLLQ